jgi:ATP-dependent RNA circularization protein (DNA/RNA ligase family)
MNGKALQKMSDLEFASAIQAKRVSRMANVDNLTPELRELVHEYGLNVVKALMDVGVQKPKQIRHIVETVLNEFSPTRGSFSSQGVSTYGKNK